jgi:hypothetical protein
MTRPVIIPPTEMVRIIPRSRRDPLAGLIKIMDDTGFEL